MTELSPEQDAAINEAIRALRRSIDRQFPPRLAEQLTAAATALAFLRMCKASSGDGKASLVEILNGELRGVGLRLTAIGS
jgi:hypothetical protein